VKRQNTKGQRALAFLMSLLLITAFLPQTAFAAVSGNQVANGDFEQGNTGFTSGYTLYAGVDPVYDPMNFGQYKIVQNAQTEVHVGFSGAYDHTKNNGEGYYFSANGSSDNTDVVWRSNSLISVTAGEVYRFEAYLMTQDSNAGHAEEENKDKYPELRFEMGSGDNSTGTWTMLGSAIVPQETWISGEPGDWHFVYADVKFESSGAYNIRLMNNQTHGYNDFGVDDIYFGLRANAPSVGENPGVPEEEMTPTEPPASEIVLRTIAFDASGGTCTTSTATTNENGKLDSLPTASKSGEAFKGWYTAASGGTQITTDYIFEGDTTVYAQFAALIVYNLGSPTNKVVSGSNVGYKLGGATVSGDTGYTFSVSVDTGSFRIGSTTLPGVIFIKAQRGDDGTVLSSLNTTEDYTYLELNFGDTPFTNSSIQAFLQNIAFSKEANTDQEISVSSENSPLPDGTVTFQGHYYQFIPVDTVTLNWNGAYNKAKTLYVNGLRGYLLTIGSLQEHNLTYQAFGGDSGWIGASRALPNSDIYDEAAFTIKPNQINAVWHWMCGPDAGKTLDETYKNFVASEPNGDTSVTVEENESVGEYGYAEDGRWNDIPWTYSGRPGTYIEFGGYPSETPNTIATIATTIVTLGASAVPPVITTQPTDQSVTEGENAEFTVEVSSPGEGTSYQWQKYVNGGWVAIGGATSSALSVSDVSAEDDGIRYRCVVTNTVGETHESTTSNEAILHVVYPVTVNVYIDGVLATTTAAVKLKQGGEEKATASNSSTGVYTASVPSGTYDVYVNGEDTGKNITVAGAAATADAVNYYTVSFAVANSGLASGSAISATAGGISIASGTVVLSGKPVVVTATGAGANSYTYQWSGTGTNGQTANTLSLTLNGKINALCTVTGSNSYSITLHANGGAINSGNVTVYNYGTPVTLPTDVTKANATFAGWYASENFSGSPVTQILATETGAKTFYAKWTNTITYRYNYTGASIYTTQTDAVHGAAPTFPDAPAREGYVFIGWYKDAACTNPWRINDTVTGDITLYARWSTVAYSITGKVVDDSTPAPNNVSGAAVRVMQGSVQFGTTAITDENGNFTITGVPNGIYNLVVTQGDHTVTIYVRVNNGNYDFGSQVIVLPTGNKNSQLEVTGSDTPDIVVDGLNELFNDANSYTSGDQTVVTDGGTVVIKLTVEKQDEGIAAGASDIQTLAAGQTIAMFLDMTLSKKQNDEEPTRLTTVGSLLKIIVPYDLSGKTNVTIYRYHGGNALAMAKLPYSETAPADEGYMLDTSGNRVIIWAKNFSTYAIAYTPGGGSSDSSGSSSQSSGNTGSVITVTAGNGGSISPSGSISVANGSSKTFTITPDKGYVIADVLVDGKSVGAVSSYTFSNITAAHTISVVFAKAGTAVNGKGLPYYYNDSGKKVFIGFASDHSGTMKYIAPTGKTVLFQENPKNFTDIAGHWGKSYIDFVTEREIFVGTSSRIFSPDAGMTRAMLATVIGRLYERSYGPLQTTGAHAFTDCSYSSWYGSYIDWCSEKGIIQGVGGGRFEPDRQITRQEMAAMLYRFAKVMKLSTGSTAGTKLNYSDAADIASWAREAALYCQEVGIITGRTGSGGFAPKDTATRAEVANALQPFIEIAVK
jgi:uncharacterized repeat protein (TIGR02543 family)